MCREPCRHVRNLPGQRWQCHFCCQDRTGVATKRTPWECQMRISRVDPFVLKIPRPEAFAGSAGAVPDTSLSDAAVRSDEQYARTGTYRSVFSQHVETMMVRIETDTGIVGYGEAQAPILPDVPKTIVDRLFRPMLIGSNPFDSQVLWHRMYDATRERGHSTSFV